MSTSHHVTPSILRLIPIGNWKLSATFKSPDPMVHRRLVGALQEHTSRRPKIKYRAQEISSFKHDH